MNSEIVTLIGSVLSALLGGGLVGGLLAYRRDRRQERQAEATADDVSVQNWNARLLARIAELERELDAERHLRRVLEDRVARLERGAS
ncbi:hypothetical protein AB0M95_40405 [Sphaerisporangium sp. NPDC051017]|uniref:hypothetical protein n=1 Tax=Sphaerisporangium sp. NPDC051017 TaxID=3154636 RepID=UPI003444F65B